MRASDFTNEARRNPEQNPRFSGHDAAIEYLKSLGELESVGVSMTNLPKLGINPKSMFNTPLGVYFYPAIYYLETTEGGDELPFMHDAPYIQIFSFDDANVLAISSLSYHGYKDNLEHLIRLGYPIDEIDGLAREAEDGRAKVSSPGGYLWYVLWNLSEKNSVQWNKLLRKLGYDVVLDWGTGTIHHNESTQGVIINPRVINHVESFQQEYTNLANRHHSIDDVYHSFVAQKKKLPKSISDYIAKNDPLKAISYAMMVLKGPFPEAEPQFLKYPRLAAKYAIEALGHRWPEGEDVIETDPYWWANYTAHFPDADTDNLKEGWRDVAKAGALSAALAGGMAHGAEAQQEPVPQGHHVVTINKKPVILPDGTQMVVKDGTNEQSILGYLQKNYPDILKNLTQQSAQPPAPQTQPQQVKPPERLSTRASASMINAAKEMLENPMGKYMARVAKLHGLEGDELYQFLAQTAHESAKFKKFQEDMDYNASRLLQVFPKLFTPKTAKKYANKPEAIANHVYANVNGNGDEASGDGWKYRGRGFMHLTGKDNYARAGKGIGQPLLQNPDLASKPEVAAQVALWFWDHQVNPKIKDYSDTTSATKPINKGLAGLTSRHNKFLGLKDVMSKNKKG